MPGRIPTSPNADTSRGRTNWTHVALVGAGGLLGTGLRTALIAGFPDLEGLPVVVFVINITGAFVLGLLLEVLARSGPDIGHRRSLRLLLGTGVIGGYTTYSTLAVGTATLILHHRMADALGYGLGTVLVGAGASVAGILAGKGLIRGAR